MPYLRFYSDDIKYDVKLSPTYTQNGYKAIRFIGEEIPDTYTKGFAYYNDDDEIISDFADYKYYYSPNIYAVEEDEIVEPKPNNTSSGGGYSSGSTALVQMVTELNKKVSEMETYTETKQAYIGDTECMFEIEKMGAIMARLMVDGVIVPCTYTIDGNIVTVSFDELEEVGQVTVFSIQ